MSAEPSKAAVEDLIANVLGGKALDAFDRYYADDVTMQENDSNRPELAKQPVAPLKWTFFLRSRQCEPTFATAT